MSSPTTLCRHIYENTGFAICPDCSKPTHEIDWETDNANAAQWRIDNPDDGSTYKWWSI